MRSGYLPNITEEFNFHKREALAALQRQDYQRATSAIKTLNECLGEDYMIEISTSKYEDELKINTTYQETQKRKYVNLI